jgi:centrosomal protein CEP104
LQQIQLLSHEYKIAGKIELQVASSDNNNNGKAHEFTRLGFLSFDPNNRTNFSARELKSVPLPDVEATAIKLIIHRCQVNNLNTYAQACLIMLNLVGEALHQEVASSTIRSDVPATTTIAPVVFSAPPAPLANPLPTTHNNINKASVSEEEGVDEVTAQRILELQEKKAAAVAIEDYDEAKKLKSAIEKLRAVGAKMAALEARKTAAVEAEDYDTAKALKIELEKMRHRAYAAIAARGDHHQYHNDYSTDINNLNSSMERIMSPVQQNTAGTALPTEHIDNATAIAAAPFSPASSSMDSYGSNGHHSPEINSSTFMQQQKPTTSGGSSDWRSYDERPARAAGAYDVTNFEEFNADSAPPGAALPLKAAGVIKSPGPLRRIDENAEHGGNINNTSMSQAVAAAAAAAAEVVAEAAPAVPCPPAPPGFPSELPLPEPLAPDDAKESGPMEALLGEFLTRCLYSKSWQLNEAGITAIATAVGSSTPDALPRLDGDGDALRLLCGIVSQGLKARIPAIAAAALYLLRALVRSAAARGFPSRDLHAALTELLPVVADRACEPSTARTREQAVEALVDISRIKESGVKSLSGIFLKSYKITESPKITQGRLQLLSALLPVLGVLSNNHSLNHSNAGGLDTASLSPGGASASAGGFSAEAVVQFCCPALQSANAEVRRAAAELVVKVGRAPGVGAQVVLPLLPVDVNPKLKEQLEENLTGEKRIKPAARPVSANAKNLSNKTGATAANVAVPRKGTKSAANSGPSSRRTSNAGAATNYSNMNNSAAPRSQASSRHPSISTSSAGAGAGVITAGKNSRPASSSTAAAQKQHQQRHDEFENAYNDQERRSSQQISSSRNVAAAIDAPTTTSIPPPPSPPHQQQPLHAFDHQQQPHYTAQEDTPSTLYTPSIAGPEFSVADEDPAPFEEELHRREATLGPSHPLVAEAASNLAIIYNQRGDGARALPLYQRALNIWEMTHGPHHPDVAHALTDIAVILLEAGHDVQGKQLLRRALGIQMELLGPMHPDVVAIKDVLDED